MISIGHLAGYIAGTVDLVGIFGPSMGDTQFKKLILVAAFGLIFAVGVTSWAVTERVLVSSRSTEENDGGFKIISKIFYAATHLPPRIQAICTVQVWTVSGVLLSDCGVANLNSGSDGFHSYFIAQRG